MGSFCQCSMKTHNRNGQDATNKLIMLHVFSKPTFLSNTLFSSLSYEKYPNILINKQVKEYLDGLKEDAALSNEQKDLSTAKTLTIWHPWKEMLEDGTFSMEPNLSSLLSSKNLMQKKAKFFRDGGDLELSVLCQSA